MNFETRQLVRKIENSKKIIERKIQIVEKYEKKIEEIENDMEEKENAESQLKYALKEICAHEEGTNPVTWAYLEEGVECRTCLKQFPKQALLLVERDERKAAYKAKHTGKNVRKVSIKKSRSK